jgi:MscS family membrane protein
MIAIRPLSHPIRLALLAALLAAPCAAQLPLPSPTPAPAAEGVAADPYGRESPHSAFLGFIQAAQRRDETAASEYLKWPASGIKPSREELVPQLKLLLDQAFNADVEKLSRSPLGAVDDGLPANLEKAGQITVGDESVDVLMVRVETEKFGAVWLFSPQTLRQVPRLYRDLKVPGFEENLPAFLRARVGSAHLWQYLGLLALLPLLFGIARVVVAVILKPVRAFLDRQGWQGDLRAALKGARAPFALVLALVLHRVATGFLYLPLLFRYRYSRLFIPAIVAAVTWLLFRVIDAFYGTAQGRLTAAGAAPRPTITLARRLMKSGVLLVMALLVLQLWGVNLTAALAGLGLGGVAFAFAARTSIENVFGGFYVLGDRVFRVGDFCKVGDVIGLVDDVTLYTTCLRTPDRTVVTVPNGTLLTARIENYSRRDKFWFHHTIGLRYETTPAQMRAALVGIRELLASDPRMSPGDTRVRFRAFGAYSLDVEIFAYILAADYFAYLEVQEDLLLKLMEVVAAAGTSVAFPSQTLYVGRDAPPSSPPDPPVPADG